MMVDVWLVGEITAVAFLNTMNLPEGSIFVPKTVNFVFCHWHVTASSSPTSSFEPSPIRPKFEHVLLHLFSFVHIIRCFFIGWLLFGSEVVGAVMVASKDEIYTLLSKMLILAF
jgi:hypothetical protein